MLLRGRYDRQCNGLGAPDVMVPLFYVNGADSNGNLITEAVTIMKDSPNRLTIHVDVQLALEIVRDAYARNHQAGVACRCHAQAVSTMVSRSS